MNPQSFIQTEITPNNRYMIFNQKAVLSYVLHIKSPNIYRANTMQCFWES